MRPTKPGLFFLPKPDLLNPAHHKCRRPRPCYIKGIASAPRPRRIPCMEILARAACCPQSCCCPTAGYSCPGRDPKPSCPHLISCWRQPVPSIGKTRPQYFETYPSFFSQGYSLRSAELCIHNPSS